MGECRAWKNDFDVGKELSLCGFLSCRKQPESIQFIRQNLNRNSAGIEIVPKYVALIESQIEEKMLSTSQKIIYANQE